jgi:hypothetical protein
MKQPYTGRKNHNPHISQWRWAKDRWLSTGGTILKYDTLEHFLVYCLGAFLFSFRFSMEAVILSLWGIGLLWEVKDAVTPHEKYGWWGGEGFSWKDKMANMIGIAIGLALHSAITRYGP